MNKKHSNNNLYSFEFEKNITPERISEHTKEREQGIGGGREENISAIRQRNALADIHTKSILNSIYAPEAEDEIQKDHFDIHYFGEYQEDRKSTFKIRQEYDLQIICSYTKSDFPQQKIGLNVYPSLLEKQQADPQHSNRKATFNPDEFRIYRVWGKDLEQITFPHEIIKAVMYTWIPSPHPFFEEGLAIAVDDLAFGYKIQIGDERKWVDEFVKEYQLKQELPTISSLLYSKDTQSDVNTFISGSFVKYLIQTFGISKFKPLYLSLTRNMFEKEVETQIVQTLNFSLAELEIQWREKLKNNSQV